MIYINKNSKNYSDWQIFVRTDKTCPLVSPNVWQDQNLFKNSGIARGFIFENGSLVDT